MEPRPENFKPVNFLDSLRKSPDLLARISKIEANPPQDSEERDIALDEVYALIDGDYICGESWVSGKFHLYDEDDKRIYGVDEITLDNEWSVFQGLDVVEVKGVDRVVFRFGAKDELDDMHLQGYAATLDQITQFHALSTEAYESVIKDELEGLKSQAKVIHDQASKINYRTASRVDMDSVDQGLGRLYSEFKQRFPGTVEIEANNMYLLSQSSLETINWREAFIDETDSFNDGNEILPIGGITGVVVPKLHPAFNEFARLPMGFKKAGAWPHLVINGQDGDSLYVVSIGGVEGIMTVGMDEGGEV